MFHQSGGCCDGSSPMCYPDGDFIVGDRDVLFGLLDIDNGAETAGCRSGSGAPISGVEAHPARHRRRARPRRRVQPRSTRGDAVFVARTRFHRRREHRTGGRAGNHRRRLRTRRAPAGPRTGSGSAVDACPVPAGRAASVKPASAAAAVSFRRDSAATPSAADQRDTARRRSRLAGRDGRADRGSRCALRPRRRDDDSLIVGFPSVVGLLVDPAGPAPVADGAGCLHPGVGTRDGSVCSRRSRWCTLLTEDRVDSESLPKPELYTPTFDTGGARQTRTAAHRAGAGASATPVVASAVGQARDGRGGRAVGQPRVGSSGSGGRCTAVWVGFTRRRSRCPAGPATSEVVGAVHSDAAGGLGSGRGDRCRPVLLVEPRPSKHKTAVVFVVLAYVVVLHGRRSDTGDGGRPAAGVGAGHRDDLGGVRVCRRRCPGLRQVLLPTHPATLRGGRPAVLSTRTTAVQGWPGERHRIRGLRRRLIAPSPQSPP